MFSALKENSHYNVFLLIYSSEVHENDIGFTEFKHDFYVYGRRQTANINFDFLFFSCNP